MNRSTYTLRRLLALVIALIMFATLFAGCGKDDTEETNGTEPSGTIEQTAAPTDEPTEPPTEEPTEAPTDPVVTVPPVTMGTVNADNLNVRAEPYTTADILKRLAINTRVEIQEQKIVDGVNWGRISEGWINLNYVTIDDGTTDDPTGNTGNPGVENENNIGTGSTADGTTGTITAEALNVRKSADADSDKVGSYVKGDKVTILEKKGNWGRTDKGWINLKYVKLDGTITNDTTDKDDTTTGSTTSTSTSELVTDGKTTVLGYGIVSKVTSLKVRYGPGTKYDQVTYITAGQRLPYYQKSGNWVRISKGWVSLSYFDTSSSIVSGAKGTINTAELNIRKEASSSSEKLGEYKKGDEVTILEVSGNWGRTDKGWISLSYVTFASGSTTSSTTTYKTGTGTITATSLYIRKAADEDADTVGTYSKGDKVTVTEISGKWGKTEKGWISMKYVEMDSTSSEVGSNTTYKTGTATVVVNSSLSIRKEAKSSSEKVGSYKNGDKVTILEVSGSWGKTDKGWISLNYVKFD